MIPTASSTTPETAGLERQFSGACRCEAPKNRLFARTFASGCLPYPTTATALRCKLPALVSLVAALSIASVGCGTKGTDDEGGEGGESSGATGGTSGSGGSSGKGGSSGATVIHEWNFDEGLEEWTIHSSSEPAALAGDTVLEWSDEEGAGDVVGSAKLTIPFDGIEQYVLLSFNVPSDIADMSGLRFEARVMLAMGLTDDPNNPGGAQPFAKGGENFVWAQGNWANIGADEKGAFINAPLTFDSPTNDEATAPLEGYDPANIREFGVKLGTGSNGTDYHEAVIYVDYVRVVQP
jgi:hypothetical protein